MTSIFGRSHKNASFEKVFNRLINVKLFFRNYCFHGNGDLSNWSVSLVYLRNQRINWCDIILNKNSLNKICFEKQTQTFQKSSESIYLHIRPNAAPSSSYGIRMFVNSIF